MTVLELLHTCARGHVTAALLKAAIEAHLQAFKRLYGSEPMTTKSHATLHFPAFLNKFGVLPNCFTLERKHKLAKRFGNEMANTSVNWDASVMREVTNHHLGVFEGMPSSFYGDGVRLLEPHPISRRMFQPLQSEFRGLEAEMRQASRSLRINQWETATVGDVVMVQQGNAIMFGEAVCFVAVTIDGAVSVLAGLSRWAILSEGLRRWKCKRRPSTPFLCMADEVVCSILWGGSGAATTALKPHRV